MATSFSGTPEKLGAPSAPVEPSAPARPRAATVNFVEFLIAQVSSFSLDVKVGAGRLGLVRRIYEFLVGQPLMAVEAILVGLHGVGVLRTNAGTLVFEHHVRIFVAGFAFARIVGGEMRPYVFGEKLPARIEFLQVVFAV